MFTKYLLNCVLNYAFTKYLLNYEPRKAYNANANNDTNDWDDQSQQYNNHNNKSDNKTKRNELSSDDESDNHGRSKKHKANVTNAVDFDSHAYSNNAVMGSTTWLDPMGTCPSAGICVGRPLDPG